MSPKRNLATSDGEKETRHRHKRHRPNRKEKEKEKMQLKMKKKIKLKMKNKKKKERRMKLEEEEANKSLYICSLEHHVGDSGSYVVRAIRLSDLFSSSSSFKHPLRLPQLAYKSGSDLPGSVGCGVWGSKIVLVGGLKPNFPYSLGAFSSDSIVWHRDVYCFETQRQDEEENRQLRKMDARFTLLQAKFYPLIVEMCGKLYALSCRLVADPPMFEVFDPKVGRWAALPTPPFFIPNSPYHCSARFSYVVAGTKMFVSHDKCPVFCFDVAHPRRQWRRVSTMCKDGPFPFGGNALVLDLPDDSSKKIMFAFTHDHWRLRVYLMSLVENMESISLIGYVKLPDIPVELGRPDGCDIVHIGGRKACVVVTQLSLPRDDQETYLYEPGTHKTWGVVIPFEFAVDMSKVDRGQQDCFTPIVMPLCVFKYRTNPSTYPGPETAGCFVL